MGIGKKLNQWIRILLSLGLGILIIWLTVRKLTDDDRSKMLAAWQRADYLVLLLAPAIGILSNFFRSERWRMLLEPMGKTPSMGNTFHSVSVMYAANLLFPRLGEVTRCTLLWRVEGIPVERSIGTMVTERLLDVLSIAVVGGLLFVVEHDRMGGLFSQTFGLKESSDALWLFPMGGIVLALLGYSLLRAFRHLPMVARIISFLRGMKDGLLSIRKVPNKGLLLLHTLLIWVCYWLMIQTSFYALPETAGLSMAAGWSCMFFGGIAMAATQGGVGAYPLALREMLLLFAVSAPVGYALGWMVWSVQTLTVLIGGGISLIWLNISSAKSSA
jgi:hypothetical protein